MGFAQEIKDFITTGMAVHKMLRDDGTADARNGYYKALTTKALKGDPLGDAVKAARVKYMGAKAARDDHMAKVKTGAIGSQEEARTAKTARDNAMAEARQEYYAAKTARDNSVAAGRVGNYESLVRKRAEPKAAAAAKPEKGAIPLIDDPEAEAAAAARVGGTAPAAMPGIVAPQSAIPMTLTSDGADDIENDVDDDDDEEGTGGYARGGAVQRFAAGGAVDFPAATVTTFTPDPAPAPQKQGAIPVDGGDTPAPAAPVEENHSKNSYGFDLSAVLKHWGDPKTGGSPVAAGLDEIQRVLHMPVTAALPDAAPAGPSAGSRLAKNEGAATVAEVKEVDKVVDPNSELTGAARTVARLDMTYRHYLANGQPEKAASIAKSLVLFGKDQAEKFGRVAVAALQHGDKEKAVKYLERAFDQVPNGHTLDAEVKDGLIHARTIDQTTGKVTELGAFSEQQVFKLALGVASGGEYMQRVVGIASQGKKGLSVPKEPKAPKPPGVEKLTDRAKSQEMIGEIKPPEGVDPEKFSKEIEDVKPAAAALLRHNDITPMAAMHLVRNLTATGIKHGLSEVDKLPDGGVVLQDEAGRQYRIPRDVARNLAAMKGLNEKRDASKKVVDDERAALEAQRAAATAPVMARARAERAPMPYIAPVGSSPY